jgi:hypothetical protein
MSFEKTLEKKVIEYLTQVGAYWVKVHGDQNQSDRADRLACICGRFVAIECKGPGGYPSPGQKRDLRKVRKAGGIAEVVYSLDTVKEIVRCCREGREWKPISDLTPSPREFSPETSHE